MNGPPVLCVPLMRDKHVVGEIIVFRRAAGAFGRREVELVQAFADQAVVAMENARLFHDLRVREGELTESLEQQTATARILSAISTSQTDTRPVFDAIVQTCLGLFPGSRVALLLLRDGWVVPEAVADATGSDSPLQKPFPLDRRSAVGACILDAQIVHVPDAKGAAEQFPRMKESPLLGLGFESRLCE